MLLEVFSRAGNGRPGDRANPAPSPASPHLPGLPPTGEHQGPTDTQREHWAACTAVSAGSCRQARVDHKLGAGSRGQGWDRHAKDLQEVQEGLGAPSAPADHEAPARGKSKEGSDLARNPSPLPRPQPPSATPLPRASAAEAGLPGSVANSTPPSPLLQLLTAPQLSTRALGTRGRAG